MEGAYSTRQAARLVRLSERRVRELARAGAVATPPTERARLAFEFGDLLLLRAARDLLDRGLAIARVKRALSQLRRDAGGPLTTVRIHVEGNAIVADRNGERWNLETGQQLLPLEAQPEGKVLSPVSSSSGAPTEERGSAPAEALPEGLDQLPGQEGLEAGDRWFEAGLSWEDSEPEQAYVAYLRALACNPEHVEATINVGRLCSTLGDLSRAAAFFRVAVRLAPTHPVAHYNLAVTLHDMGSLEEAKVAYLAAIEHDPNFSDAHFNLAALLEQEGDQRGSVRHVQAYQRSIKETLDPTI